LPSCTMRGSSSPAMASVCAQDRQQLTDHLLVAIGDTLDRATFR
jgi:hypothetical protein